MNKEERSLTWKYFCQQKAKEISITVIIIAAIVFIPYLLGHYIGDNQSEFCGERTRLVENCSTIQNWFEGLFYFIFGGLVLLFVAAGLREWIRSNWKKAKKRAKTELKKEKKK